MLAEWFGADRISAVVNIEGNVSLGDCQYSGLIAGYSLPEFLEVGRPHLLENLYRRGGEDMAHRGYFVSMRLAQPDMLYLHSQDLVRLSEEERLREGMMALPVPILYLAGVPNGICKRSLQLLKDSTLDLRCLRDCGDRSLYDPPPRSNDTACRLALWLRGGLDICG